MISVIFDTNVYISALITPHGRADEAYQLAIDGRIRLYTSVAILTELAGKLQNKFKWETNRVSAAISHIAAVSTVLKPSNRINAVIDEPDNRILECAVTAKATNIVTGDRHLLDLIQYEGIYIITITEFIKNIALPVLPD